ncbi:MAG: hypothetical protein V1897_04115 [Pseudomonadota bacterium]
MSKNRQTILDHSPVDHFGLRGEMLSRPFWTTAIKAHNLGKCLLITVSAIRGHRSPRRPFWTPYYNLPYHTNKARGKVSNSSETINLKLKAWLVLERDLDTAFNRVIPYVPKNHPSDSYGEANREVLENGTSGTGMTTDRLFLVEAAI